MISPISYAISCMLQISQTMPKLSFRGWHELSTDLQLQQKDQNHVPISRYYQARGHVSAKADS